MYPTNVKSSSQAYPSNKPLGNWTRDLVLRVEQFAKWATTAHQPVIFWMSGFTFPTGFLTAVLQTCARQNNISVDSLSWEFVVSTVDDSNITQQPKVNLVSLGEGAGGFRSLAPQSFMYDLRVTNHGKHSFVRKNYLFKRTLSVIVHFRNKHLSSAVIRVLVDSEADLPPLMVCATPKSLGFLFVCLSSCSFHFLEQLRFRDITDLSCVLLLQVRVSMLPPRKWGCDVRC